MISSLALAGLSQLPQIPFEAFPGFGLFINDFMFQEFKPAFLDTLRCLGLCTCCKDDLRNFNNYTTNIYFRVSTYSVTLTHGGYKIDGEDT